MNDEAILKAARLQASGSSAIVRALGMLAHNVANANDTEMPMFGPPDFEQIINEVGLDWNTIVGLTTP